MAQEHAEAGDDPSGTPGWKSRTSMVALLLLGLATVGSSWCSYQSSLWSGIQTFQLSDSAALSREADKKATLAVQQRSLDAALFVEYARDIDNGDSRMADFVLERMRPDLQDTIRAWMALRPLQNRDAPATPFSMPQYKLKADAEAADLSNRSSSAHDRAQRASATGDRYSLLTVLYATALFLFGLVSTIDQRRPRLITLLIGLAVFLLATGVATSLPVAESAKAAGTGVERQDLKHFEPQSIRTAVFILLCKRMR